jgi:hypothetical protein
MEMKMQTNEEVSIIIGVATAHCAIGVTSIHCTVSGETEKALKVSALTESGKEVSAWFPRKAFVNEKLTKYGKRVEIAKWFKANGWTARFMELSANSSFIAA